MKATCQIHQLIEELHQILPFNLISYDYEKEELSISSFSRTMIYREPPERAIEFLQIVKKKMPNELRGTGFEMESKEA